MTDPTQMDPADFVERLERSFGAEPGHARIEEDLLRGRRRLLHRRVGSSFAALAAVAVAAGTASLLPGPATQVPVAAGGQSDSQVVQACLSNEVTPVGMEGLSRAEVLRRMGAAQLMTRADAADRTVATVRSGDGRLWADCTLSYTDPAAVKVITVVYGTDVTFPRTVVDGVHAFEPQSESDLRLVGTAGTPVPRFQVTCQVVEPEETRAYALAESRCPTYSLTWNDRRPAVVGEVALTTPDGKEVDADVKDGYVSLAYTGRMTSQMSEHVARGETPQARRVTFYDKDGHLLVDDRDPGHRPQDGSLSIANFPSLAWWLRQG